MARQASAGLDKTAAAASIGLLQQTYSLVRDVIKLADRTDLPPSDSALVRDTLAAMNERRQVRGPYAAIEPIAARVWGPVSAGRRVDRDKIEARRRHKRTAFANRSAEFAGVVDDALSLAVLTVVTPRGDQARAFG